MVPGLAIIMLTPNWWTNERKTFLFRIPVQIFSEKLAYLAEVLTE